MDTKRTERSYPRLGRLASAAGPGGAPAFLLACVFASLLVLAGAGAAFAGATNCCAAPLSGAADPVASDCLFILNEAIGAECSGACECDVDGNDSVTATDALICLNASVGIDVTLACDCPAACTPDPTTTTSSTSSTSMVTVSTTMGTVTTSSTTTTTIDTCGGHLATFGEAGGDEDDLSTPVGLALNADEDRLFVAEFGGDRVMVIDVSTPSTPTFESAFGSEGDGESDFNEPRDVALDSNGDVYVVDGGNNRISKWTSDGEDPPTFTHDENVIDSAGNGEGQLNTPKGIAIDASDVFYIADSTNDRVQTFDSSGTFVGVFGTTGSANRQFEEPRGIAVDTSGNIYVADIVRDDVQKFASDFTFLTKWGESGTESGQFEAPRGIAIDASGRIFVADRDNDRVQVFDPNGGFLAQFGSAGVNDGEFNGVGGVVVDSAYNVYVSDLDGNRIQVFSCTPD